MPGTGSLRRGYVPWWHLFSPLYSEAVLFPDTHLPEERRPRCGLSSLGFVSCSLAIRSRVCISGRNIGERVSCCLPKAKNFCLSHSGWWELRSCVCKVPGFSAAHLTVVLSVISMCFVEMLWDFVNILKLLSISFGIHQFFPKWVVIGGYWMVIF